MSLHTHIQQQYREHALVPVIDDGCLNTLVTALPMSLEQKQVVNFAINQIACVIQGPPGTGKTQTLVNLVANLLAQQHSVLGLSAKPQGNYAVTEKMVQANISELALDLSELPSTRLLLDKLKRRYHSAYVDVQAFDFKKAQATLAENSAIIKHLNATCVHHNLTLKSLISMYLSNPFSNQLASLEAVSSPAQLDAITNSVTCFENNELDEPLHYFADGGKSKTLIQCLAQLPLLTSYKAQQLKQLIDICGSELPEIPNWQTCKTQLKLVSAFHNIEVQRIAYKKLWATEVSDAFWQLNTEEIQQWLQSKWYTRWLHKNTALAFKAAVFDISPEKGLSLLLQYNKLREKSTKLAQHLSEHMVELSRNQLVTLQYVDRYFPHLSDDEFLLLKESVEALKDSLLTPAQPVSEMLENASLSVLIRCAKKINTHINEFIVIADWYKQQPAQLANLFMIALKTGELESLFSALKQKFGIDSYMKAHDLKLPLHQLNEIVDKQKQLVADIAYHTKHRLASMMQTKPLSMHQQSVLRFYLSERKPSLGIVDLLHLLRPQVQILFPYILATPKTAKLLSDLGYTFNNLVVDEASQLQLSEVTPTLSNCSQVCFFGDEQQMPPSQWFSNDSQLNENCESVLGYCYRYNVPTKMLTEHYRSKHSDLIAFSNKHFYQNKLKCISALSKQPESLFFHQHSEPYVPAPSCTNTGEANKLVTRLVSLSKQHKPKSIAIICSNAQQVKVIEKALNEAKKGDHEFTKWLALCNAIQPTIIGNLDSFQGLERDWVFVSFTYGKQHCGKLSQQFGVFSQPAGERRLNVLLTRATERIEWFSNITDSDINIGSQTPLGVNYLKHFLTSKPPTRLTLS